MGLNFSHCDAQWSYSGFMTFRKAICRAIGVISSLDEEIFNSGIYKFLVNDPIYPLINHSDCEGILTVEEMQLVYPRLEEIKLIWENDPFFEFTSFHDMMAMEELINGMKNAISKGEPIEFH